MIVEKNVFLLNAFVGTLNFLFLDEIPYVPVPNEAVVKMRMSGSGCECENMHLLEPR